MTACRPNGFGTFDFTQVGCALLIQLSCIQLGVRGNRSDKLWKIKMLKPSIFLYLINFLKFLLIFYHAEYGRLHPHSCHFTHVVQGTRKSESINRYSITGWAMCGCTVGQVLIQQKRGACWKEKADEQSSPSHRK